MSTTIEMLEVEVLRLPHADRARLLDRLIASLDADEAMEAAWDAIAAQREMEIASGTTQLLPLDALLASLEARFPG
ncbi:MAG: addiction module protein [Porticoccaceae bacterium]